MGRIVHGANGLRVVRILHGIRIVNGTKSPDTKLNWVHLKLKKNPFCGTLNSILWGIETAFKIVFNVFKLSRPLRFIIRSGDTYNAPATQPIAICYMLNPAGTRWAYVLHSDGDLRGETGRNFESTFDHQRLFARIVKQYLYETWQYLWRCFGRR